MSDISANLPNSRFNFHDGPRRRRGRAFRVVIFLTLLIGVAFLLSSASSANGVVVQVSTQASLWHEHAYSYNFYTTHAVTFRVPTYTLTSTFYTTARAVSAHARAYRTYDAATQPLSAYAHSAWDWNPSYYCAAHSIVSVATLDANGVHQKKKEIDDCLVYLLLFDKPTFQTLPS